MGGVKYYCVGGDQKKVRTLRTHFGQSRLQGKGKDGGGGAKGASHGVKGVSSLRNNVST